MIKYFRKIEKVINHIAVIAIVVVLAMIVLWFIGYSQAYYQELVPFIAFAAFVFFGYKVIILILSYYYQTEISKIANKLDAKRQKDDDHLKKEDGKKIELSPIIETVKQMPEANTDAIIGMLQERLPQVVQKLVDQRVTEIKRNMEKENEARIREINLLAADVSDVIDRRNYLIKLQNEIKLQQEEDRKNRLALTLEYTQLVFSLAGMFVEDVEKVCDDVKLFIETGQVSTDKDLCIPLNKKLRNAEIKQFVYNIIRYNEKENLDAESFLQTAFGEWFSGKKENISKNYNVLPKDSLVSKEGVEADLVKLRIECNCISSKDKDMVL